jgi:hypothetical protein
LGASAAQHTESHCRLLRPKILLVNPTPGANGNLAPRSLEGPGSFSLDPNLIKRIQLAETKSIELRADALSVLNRPNFFNRITVINDPNFGRINGAGGNRIMAVSMRLNF